MINFDGLFVEQDKHQVEDLLTEILLELKNKSINVADLFARKAAIHK